MASSKVAPQQHKVVSPSEWLAARKQFLVKEKEFTRMRDELSRQRRELPWEKVEKNYTFDAPSGKVTLADLFDKRGQLIVYHFMFGPGWKEGCPSCSMIADQFDAFTAHLANRGTTLVAISHAPIADIEAFKKRLGWQFKWVSSFNNDFNRDYHVSFTKDEMAAGNVNYNYEQTKFPAEEAPGASVFATDAAGNILHTYATFGRGLDILLGVYNFLDLVPKGRDEQGLSFPMAWVRHHDRYEQAYFANPTATGSAPQKSDASCCDHHS